MTRTGRWWPTLNETARGVREALSRGDSASAIRVLADGINQITPDTADIHTLRQPETTGDLRWDALLAGALRYRLRTLGAPAPEWSWQEPLPRFWWPLATTPSETYNDLAHTPPELFRLGIRLDEREFSTA